MAKKLTPAERQAYGNELAGGFSREENLKAEQQRTGIPCPACPNPSSCKAAGKCQLRYFSDK